MFKLQKIFGDVQVSKDLLLLLAIGGLYSLSIALSNTFVNVYLWKQSGEFLDLGIYNLSIVVMQPLTFIFAGRLAKKIDRVIILRLGVIFLAIFFLTVLVIGDLAAKLLVVIGGTLGIGYGFYWLAFNVLTFEITEPETRDFFNGFLGIMNSTAGMVGPIIAGYVISRLKNFTGYTTIFTISLILFSGAVILSFFLTRRPAEGSYLLKRIIQERKHNQNWKRITNAHFFQGLREGTFAFVIGVFVFITTGSELALGKFGLINSAVAFLAYFLAARIIKKSKRKIYILMGGILLYLSIFIILFDLTYQKLIIYAVLIAIGYPMLLVPYSSITYDVIGHAWNIAKARIEYIVVKEIFLNAGRIGSIVCFIIAVRFFNEKQSIPILLAIIGIGHLLIFFFVRKIHLKGGKEIIDETGQKPVRKANLVDGDSGA
ncbi:MFS transporter [Metabacillus niabensis]|uniref:YQGE family putative transporter n=1 Tax=Metabacillus niabensis TaxID=324854 RepID=A0ABT9YXZ2_9BACI|nr:MFS transporter [Metabacillus niabensis]MDQ0224859.1 YQGE family putative transporter [Metabacillus niabensis]